MAMLLSGFDFLPIYRADLAGSRTLSFSKFKSLYGKMHIPVPSNALVLIVTDSFTLRTQSVSWQEAGKRCALDGAHLAVYSDAASPTLTKLVKNINGRVWIDTNSKGKFFIAMFA